MKEPSAPLPDAFGARHAPVSLAQWNSWLDPSGKVTDEAAVREAVFYGGVAPEARRDIWAHFLNHRCGTLVGPLIIEEIALSTKSVR